MPPSDASRGKRPNVLLTAPIEPAGMRDLERFAEILTSPSREAAVIRELAADVEGIIACSPVPDDIFDHAPRLRAIVRHGAGYDIIPAAEALARGIGVAYAPGANARSVAEHAIGAIFELVRRYRLLDRDLRLQGWDAARAASRRPTELAGKRLGIVGLGAIGSEVAAMAHAGLGMEVLGSQCTLHRLPDFVKPAPLREVFAASDFIVLACPLTPETRSFVDADSLSRMKPT